MQQIAPVRVRRRIAFGVEGRPAPLVPGDAGRRTSGSRRAGWPRRRSRVLGAARASRSTRLSTATLDAAQASTRAPPLTSCTTASTTAVVLPAPPHSGERQMPRCRRFTVALTDTA